MNKIKLLFLLAFFALAVGPKPVYASSEWSPFVSYSADEDPSILSALLTAIKVQAVDQTKLTIHKNGGIAGFYDASVQDNKLRQGVLSHILTNRFLAASLGWYSADNKEGVLVGGPSVKGAVLLETLLPGLSLAEIPVIKKFDFGFNFGWGTDGGSQHYGFHLMYDFGK
ncbi:MAG: hypothetical protein U1E51_17685 [Candidatus Binatia bacterium]|nr:hypothetical protein [Candidatus Binatia bacterium]